MQELGEDAEGPFDIQSTAGGLAEAFASHDAVVVGTPTYNTDADTRRSGTAWDSVLYGELQDLDLTGKHVACFGLGDQHGYSSNFADAVGELHDVFQEKGARMFGYTSVEGYEHEVSKSQRGDHFIALVCDAVNDPDSIDSRVSSWVKQLRAEGFLVPGSKKVKQRRTKSKKHVEADVKASVAKTIEDLVHSSPKDLEVVVDAIPIRLQEEAKFNYLQYGTAHEDSSKYPEFVPFRSSATKQTLWMSKVNYRQSFYTQDNKKVQGHAR